LPCPSPYPKSFQMKGNRQREKKKKKGKWARITSVCDSWRKIDCFRGKRWGGGESWPRLEGRGGGLKVFAYEFQNRGNLKEKRGGRRAKKGMNGESGAQNPSREPRRRGKGSRFPIRCHRKGSERYVSLRGKNSAGGNRRGGRSMTSLVPSLRGEKTGNPKRFEGKRRGTQSCLIVSYKRGKGTRTS